MQKGVHAQSFTLHHVRGSLNPVCKPKYFLWCVCEIHIDNCRELLALLTQQGSIRDVIAHPVLSRLL